MRVIGLTGGIATGKSTVAALLTGRGAALIDADIAARDVVRPGSPALAEIAERFGESVIRDDGGLDRAALGTIVFADPAARHDLEAITHPRIRALMAERIAAALSGTAPVVMVDIPLLFETGREADFPDVLLVYATREQQLHRLMERDGLAAIAAQQRVDAQLDIDEKRRRATWVIDNSGTPEETVRRVADWWAAAVATEHTPQSP